MTVQAPPHACIYDASLLRSTNPSHYFNSNWRFRKETCYWIVESNGESTRLDYLIRQDRISDVYLDSTVSQLAVRRSEFHSILQQEGIDGLVTALNRKVDLLKSVARAP